MRGVEGGKRLNYAHIYNLVIMVYAGAINKKRKWNRK